MTKGIKRAALGAFGGMLMGAMLWSPAASAAPVFTAIGADLTASPYTFTLGEGSFTFSATGDIFAPLAVKTAGTAEINSFGGFFIFPLEPTTNFIDRGTVVFGPDSQFDPFPTTTPVRFSNGGNFIGLSTTLAGLTYYGFAYTTNTTLNSIGFETVAGREITATTAVPEPATWAMMIVGVAAVGGAARGSRRRGMLRAA